MTRLGLAVLCIVLIPGPVLAGDDRERYIVENRLLKEEAALARKPVIYFVFNLRQKLIHINVRGIHLREMPIRDCRYWGSPSPGAAYSLETKSALVEPDREVIRPGKKKGDFKVEALELGDMPSRYTLSFDGGLTVAIRPETMGIVSGTGNLLAAAKRFLTRPAATLWHALRGKPYTAVDVVLDRDDARAVYWSIFEGSSAVVYPP